MTTTFFHPSLLLLFLDPGSGIRDPGFGIRSACVGNFLAHTQHAQKTQNGEYLP
jgi:hypothetical protein